MLILTFKINPDIKKILFYSMDGIVLKTYKQISIKFDPNLDQTLFTYLFFS